MYITKRESCTKQTSLWIKPKVSEKRTYRTEHHYVVLPRVHSNFIVCPLSSCSWAELVLTEDSHWMSVKPLKVPLWNIVDTLQLEGITVPVCLQSKRWRVFGVGTDMKAQAERETVLSCLYQRRLSTKTFCTILHPPRVLVVKHFNRCRQQTSHMISELHECL